jgi:hypothetical protein
MNATDSIVTMRANNIRFFKPVRPGAYTTSGAPSATLWPGYIIYNTDSSVHQYSNGTNWINMVGNNSVYLPVVPDGYTLIRSGVTYDSSRLVWYDRTNGRIFFGSTHGTYPVNFDSTLMFGSTKGLTFHGRTSLTNYGDLQLYTVTGNGWNFDIKNGGTIPAGYFSFNINGTAKLQIDASNAIWSSGMLFSGDSTYNIGRLSASALRPLNMYLARSIAIGNGQNNAALARLHVGPGLGGTPQMYLERSANPSSPIAGLIWRSAKLGTEQLFFYNGTDSIDLLNRGSVDTTVISTKWNVTNQINQAVQSGVWTPTSGNEVGVTSSSISANSFMYQRIGGVVSFSGTMGVTPSAATFELSLTMPFASAFTNGIQCTGAVVVAVSGISGDLSSDYTNDKIHVYVNNVTAGIPIVITMTGHYIIQ